MVEVVEVVKGARVEVLEVVEEVEVVEVVVGVKEGGETKEVIPEGGNSFFTGALLTTSDHIRRNPPLRGE